MSAFPHRPTRRQFLRAAGVSIALPLLARDVEAGVGEPAADAPTRMVCLCTGFGLHSEYFVPQTEGRDYETSPYLKLLAGRRDDFTVFSGLSHPEVDGGHSSEMSFLTAAPHPSAPSFRNTISLDQYAVRELAPDTRFPFLTLTTGGGGLSWTAAGVQIPAEDKPSQVYSALFLQGSEADRERRRRELADGRSVLDLVRDRAMRMEKSGAKHDRETLQQYFTSVRELEGRLQASQAWVDRPKPHVDVPCPADVTDRAELSKRQEALYDMAALALQTDSTRVITMMFAGNSLKPPIEGVETDWHNLSHHGRDPEKIAQLRRIEEEQLRLLAGFLDRLAETPEQGGRLLDSTMVLFGSNLGNASNHSTANMPILLAGGAFDHGRHLAYDPADPPALAKLYVTLLQKLGVETDRFASGDGTLV